MKKLNIPKIIWISSIFLTLILILLLIMNYKINYEYLTYNYLYFYECEGNNLCVSEVKDSSKLIFSKYDCGYNSCPKYIKQLEDDYVILESNTNQYILYNYRTSTIISNKYKDYQLINNNYIIVTNANNKKGIINLEDKIIVNNIYDEIGYNQEEYLSGYNLNNILVKKDDLYGIISFKDGKIIEEIKYTKDNLNTLLEKIKSQ